MNTSTSTTTTLQPTVRRKVIQVDLRKFGRGRAQFRGYYAIRPPSVRTLSPKSRHIDFERKIQDIQSDEEDEPPINVLGQEMPLIQDVGSKQLKNTQMDDQQAKNLSSNNRTRGTSKKAKKMSKKGFSNHPSKGFQPGNRRVDATSGQNGQKNWSAGHLYVYKCPQVRNGVGRRQI